LPLYTLNNKNLRKVKQKNIDIKYICQTLLYEDFASNGS